MAPRKRTLSRQLKTPVTSGAKCSKKDCIVGSWQKWNALTTSHDSSESLFPSYRGCGQRRRQVHPRLDFLYAQSTLKSALSSSYSPIFDVMLRRESPQIS